MYVNIDPSNIKVALIAGGKSNERDVSLNSAKGAKQALEQAGFNVEQFDPKSKEDLKAIIDGDFDVAFLCLHGKGGEDGSIQGFCETIDLPYTCSNIWSCATSIDKEKTKLFYKKAGIPTPESISGDLSNTFDIDDILCKLGQKCVVKAATEGSSIGVFITEGAEELRASIAEALKIDDSLIIERYVVGNEYTIVVIDDIKGTRALPIIQIIPKSDSYDFESKYAPGGSEHICPAELPEDIATRMQEYAVKAHKCLECNGVSRSDFILDPNGDMWMLETNTIPGMTTTSLLPDAARAEGMAFPDLCTLLIAEAYSRKNAVK